MDDGSKSTDKKNAHEFKERKSKKYTKKTDESEEEPEVNVLKPKRAQSAYIFFSSEFMKSHKDDPEAKEHGLMKYSASKWATMSENDKM